MHYASRSVVCGMQWCMSPALRFVVVVRSSWPSFCGYWSEPRELASLGVKDAHIDGCLVADPLLLLWSTVARCVSDGVYVVNYGDLVPHLLVCVAAAIPTECWGRY